MRRWRSRLRPASSSDGDGVLSTSRLFQVLSDDAAIATVGRAYGPYVTGRQRLVPGVQLVIIPKCPGMSPEREDRKDRWSPPIWAPPPARTLADVNGSIRFPVTLDGIRDTRQLQQRRVVAMAAPGVAVTGVIVWLLGYPGGIVLVALGALIALEWRFPIFDAWFDRRRLIVGSDCELWLDESGLRYHQAREGTFETSGQVDWSRISGLMENDRAMLVMGGRAVLVAIPKAHVDSAEQLAAFRDEVRRTIAERHRESGKPDRAIRARSRQRQLA